MKELERILMECRYLLSLDKSYNELAKIFHISYEEVFDDLNNKLKRYDHILYTRVNNFLERNK